ALARARHLALVGRAHRPRRLGAARLLRARAVRDDRPGNARASRSHAREPRLVVRARVQPAGAARAGRCRPHSSRGVPDRAARRHAHVGGAASVPIRARRRPGRARLALARASRRMLRAQPCPRPRRPRGRRTHVATLTGIALPHAYTGKVRDLYDVDHERMLIGPSVRIPVFDVVLGDLVPDKGRALTAISTFWFESTGDLAPTHLTSSDPTDFPETAGSDVAGRAMLVRATQPVRLECIGRGYLFGSAWSEYEDRGTVYGQAMPSRLRQAERLPEPIFTATTKAESGHDEPLTDSAATELVGGELLERIRDITLRVYGFGA